MGLGQMPIGWGIGHVALRLMVNRFIRRRILGSRWSTKVICMRALGFYRAFGFVFVDAIPRSAAR